MKNKKERLMKKMNKELLKLQKAIEKYEAASSYAATMALRRKADYESLEAFIKRETVEVK